MVTKMLGKQINAVKVDTIFRSHSMAVQCTIKSCFATILTRQRQFLFCHKNTKTIKTHFITRRTKLGLFHTQAKNQSPYL